MLQLDDYLVNTEDVIGKGTQAKIVVAQKKNDSKLYCAKIIPESQNTQQNKPDEPRNTDKELKIINLLKGKQNDNLVPVHYANYLKDRTEFIIIMEKCESDLEKQMMIQPNKKYSEIETIQIMRQVFNGYSLLYSNCIIHRDIKPPNILIQNGVYKIADFGIAKIYNQNDTLLDITRVGTPAYKAPELHQGYQWTQRDKTQLENQKFTFDDQGKIKKQQSFEASDLKFLHKVDIYSFGILLFHMLTGEYPFSLDLDGLFGFLEQLPIKPYQVPQKYGISKKFTTLIERMLLYSPFERIGFEEIVKMPEFALKIPAIVNYKKLDAPITPPPKYIFYPNMADPNKDIVDWTNQFRLQYLWKCNENPLVTNTQRNYCDALLQLSATSISNLGTPQNIEVLITKILNTQRNEIPFTLPVNLQKSYYITQFISLNISMMNQGIFKYDKTREYSEEYLKFIYHLYKLANKHYDYRLLDTQPQLFKQQIMSDDQILSKQGMKQYLDSL